MSAEYYYILHDEPAAGSTDLLDPHDPFDNPSEFHSYQCDYGHIVPEIRFINSGSPGLILFFRIPAFPLNNSHPIIHYHRERITSHENSEIYRHDFKAER